MLPACTLLEHLWPLVGWTETAHFKIWYHLACCCLCCGYCSESELSLDVFVILKRAEQIPSHISLCLLSFKELASSSSADRQNPREWCKIFQALSCTPPLLWTPRHPSLGFLVCLQYQLLWSSCTMLWLPCYALPGSFVSLQYVLEVSRNKRRWSVTKCRQVNSRNKLTPNPRFVNISCRALHWHWQKIIWF